MINVSGKIVTAKLIVLTESSSEHQFLKRLVLKT